MNELLEQFLIECRELIEAATMDLLALETAPEDKERLDGAFRGFHTLKGAAGIVEFAAMGKLLHAAEEILVAVRAGSRGVSGELISDCLASLDQVARWLDETEAAGAVPSLPEDEAAGLLARFASRENAEPASVDPAVSDMARPVSAIAEPASPVADWVALFVARHAAEHHRARTALRYIPPTDCFLRGEDPLALIARIPDIIALELIPRQAWPKLDELDPFACDLVITVLTAASASDVSEAMRTSLGETSVVPVTAAALSPEALAVLREQSRLAANTEAEGFAGRLASAALVSVNILRRFGLTPAADTVAAAAERGASEGDAAAFIAALGAALGAPTGVEANVPATPASPAPAASDEATPRVQVTRALRVDMDRIDALVRLAGELTVAKNAMGHAARMARDGADAETLARLLKDQHSLLDRLVDELQRSVLAIRVLPLQHVFQNFPRLVREMARELGKPVRLVIEGETTEADKSTVEALFEPLLHVLRNAMDHGIEIQAERRAAGKPAEATVRLRAARDGDRVIVEVTDDGRGIDPADIRLAAERRGVASAAALADMPDAAVIELIFSAGFSTAAAVTGLSGRGVGMDAVRASVTRLGGRVAVSTEKSIGTSVVFTLPFTVMMMRVMTVEAGGQIFGIPIDAVVETTLASRERITPLGAARAVVIRERTLPLIRLTELLGLEPSETEGDLRIVVVAVAGQAGTGAAEADQRKSNQREAEQLCALEVESFGERMDVMLRPMEGLLAGVPGFAGTTLLGDGRVLLILDPVELSR